MEITYANDLQEKFKAGMIIVGENEDGELEWIAAPRKSAADRIIDELNKLKKKNEMD